MTDAEPNPNILSCSGILRSRRINYCEDDASADKNDDGSSSADEIKKKNLFIHIEIFNFHCFMVKNADFSFGNLERLTKGVLIIM